MTTIADPAVPLDDTGLPLLSEKPRRAGPGTTRLLVRTATVLAIVEALGIALLLVGGRVLSTLGTGLLFPGGGLLYTARPVLFVCTLALVALGVVLWWALSLSWAIPAVWATSAIAAVALLDGPRLIGESSTTWPAAIPLAALAAAATVGAAAWSFEHRFRSKRARVAELNDYLRTATIPEQSRSMLRPGETDAELLRWCHELALQPVDGFEGFEWGEQYHGGTCVRYQLNYLGWALSAFAVNYVPNAPRTIERVLRNLVLKQTDLRVWGYWRNLNLLGNFDADPDPLVKDNIMFSGFTGDQINMYAIATGSRRFDEPGSLTFVWKDGRTFSYDHNSWMEQVRRNFEESRLGFFPCEPGWAFAACNTIGAQALLGYDTIHGTDLWSDYEPRWRETLLEEYLMPDGNYANIRCTRTGLSWDTGETPGGEYLTTGTNQFTDVAPDLAARGRALAVRGLDEKLGGLAMLVDDDGALPLELPEEWERNRARKTALNSWTKLVAGARMLGDDRLASAAVDASDRQCRTGARWPDLPLTGGVQSTATHLIVRWSTPLTNGDLNVRGYVAPVGPLLDAPWPEVLVSEARSHDGRSLTATIHPGATDPDGPVDLTFEQLESDAAYELFDEAGLAPTRVVHSSSAGTATAELLVDRPLIRIGLRPVGTEGAQP